MNFPGNPLANPMAAMGPDQLRAQQLKQTMMIMGGLGPQVPPQAPGQGNPQMALGPMNPMQGNPYVK